MRFIIAAVSALAAVVSAQSLSDLPKCAQDCVGTSLASTGCSGLQIACICNSTQWIAGLSCCVKDTCSQGDIQTTIKFADQLCSTYGITLPTDANAACALKQNGTSSASATASRASSSAAAAASATKSGSADQTHVGAGLGIAALVAALL